MRQVMRCNQTLTATLDSNCETELYYLKPYMLDHMLVDLERFRCLQSLDTSLPNRVRRPIKDVHRTIIQWQGSKTVNTVDVMDTR